MYTSVKFVCIITPAMAAAPANKENRCSGDILLILVSSCRLQEDTGLFSVICFNPVSYLNCEMNVFKSITFAL